MPCTAAPVGDRVPRTSTGLSGAAPRATGPPLTDRCQSIDAAYDPRDPGRVLPLRPRGLRIRDAVLVVPTVDSRHLFAGGAVAAVIGAILGTFGSPI